MKYLFLLTLAVALGARAGDTSGKAVECRFGDTYFLMATTDLRAFMELRSYEKDRILDSVVLDSRYMPPEFAIKDLVAGDSPEFIIRTKNGGTGLSETHLAVYGIVGRTIQRFGDFVIDRQVASWPDSEYREKLSGKVSFPKRNELLYRYTQVLTQNGKTRTNAVTQMFSFDPKKGGYERAKEPNKPAAPNPARTL
jgi:hypothetical protein